MRNLKKVLALVMVFAMSLTVMASAAFTDADEITAKDAVETLSTLNIIKGYDDGSFKPGGIVTRAEMAKMIYTLRMRGNDDASSYANLSSSFTDLYNDWYKGYVKWAQSAGIVAGKSNAKFDPDATVTGTEAAKMLLTLGGYAADRAGLVGAQWETNTIKYAGQAKLLDGVNTDLSQGLPRQYAAQMMYNALHMTMVQWSTDAEAFVDQTDYYTNTAGVTSLTNVTIGLKYMDLRELDAIFDGDYKMGVTSKSGYVQFDPTNTSVSAAVVPYTMANDLAWVGEEVTVLFQDNNIKGTSGQLDENDTIYGVTNSGKTTVYNVTKGQLQKTTDANKIKFGGTTYSVKTGGLDTVYKNYVEYSTTAATADATTAANALHGGAATAAQILQYDYYNVASYQTGGGNRVCSTDTIKFVTDDSGKIASAYVVAREIADITTLSSTKIAVRGKTSENIGDVTVYDGASVGDIVYYYKMYTNDEEIIVEKAETVSGTLSAIQSTGLTVGGTYYDASAMKATLSNDYDVVDYVTGYVGGVITSPTSDDIGDEVTIVLDGAYWVAADKSATTVKDYAMVTGYDKSGTSAYGTVSMLLADGTTKSYSVHKDSVLNDAVLAAAAGGPVAGYPDTAIMVTYSVSSSGVKLTAVTNTAASGNYDKSTTKLTYGGASTVTASGAVAFLYWDNEWKAYTVSTLGDVTANLAVTSTIYAGLDSSTGYVAAFSMASTKKPTGSSATTRYAYIIGTPSTAQYNGDQVTSVKVWTESGDQIIYIDSYDWASGTTSIPKLKKGMAIAYEDSATNVIDEVSILSDDAIVSSTNPYANYLAKIDSYSSSRIVFIDSAGATQSYAVSKDMVIIGVNTADIEGEGGSLMTYDKSANVVNSIVVLDDDNEVAAVFIDINNNYKLVS